MKRLTEKELKVWSNQKVVIECTMEEAGDLMDLLFMADGGPINNYFRDTIKLNKMEKSYAYWLTKMTDTACPELKDARKKTKRK